MPHKRSHAAQSADRRPSRHAGTDPHVPAAQPAIFPVTSSPIPAWLSSPTPLPKQSPAHPTLSRHAGTDTHKPATQPAILAAHQLPHFRTSLLSKPCFPQSEARHTPHFPTTQAQTHTVQLPSPLSSPFTSSPIPAWLSSPTPLPKQSPAHPTLSRHAGTDPHDPAPHSLFSPLTSFTIPAHLSSPSDLYKNPGSRPPPGFFVISGSVRSPSQRRLR